MKCSRCVLIVIFLLSIAGWGIADTQSCACEVNKIYHGKVGGYDSRVLVQCTDSTHILGAYDDERVKQRFSLALTALASGRSLTFQYWSSASLPTCNELGWDEDKLPNGVIIE